MILEKIFLKSKYIKHIKEEGNIISAKIYRVKECLWLKVNTKPIRKDLYDGALFPHMIYFTYTVDGVEYKGKKYISYRLLPPKVGEEIDVYYDKQNPKRYVAELRSINKVIF